MVINGSMLMPHYATRGSRIQVTAPIFTNLQFEIFYIPSSMGMIYQLNIVIILFHYSHRKKIWMPYIPFDIYIYNIINNLPQEGKNLLAGLNYLHLFCFLQLVLKWLLHKIHYIYKIKELIVHFYSFCTALFVFFYLKEKGGLEICRLIEMMAVFSLIFSN